MMNNMDMDLQSGVHTEGEPLTWEESRATIYHEMNVRGEAHQSDLSRLGAAAGVQGRQQDGETPPLAPSVVETPRGSRMEQRSSWQADPSRGGASGTQVKPRDYDGSAPWKAYYSQFIRVARCNNWNDRECLNYLWLCLTGPALSFVVSVPQEQSGSFTALCGALEKRFGEERAVVSKAELMSTYRRRGQTLPELAQEIRRMVDNAYPGFPRAAQEEIAVDRFTASLGSATLRRVLYQASPATLDAAIELGLRHEAWDAVESSRPGRMRMVRPEMSDDEEGDDPQERLRTVRCFRCRGVGHMAKNCKKPIKCYRCGKMGHIAPKCREELPKQSGNE